MVRLLAIVDGGAARAAGLPAIALGRLDLVVAPGTAEPAAPVALRAHDAAVRAIAARVDALLPAAFGVAGDEDELRAGLAPRAAELGAYLDRVRGREQMTVRVVGEEVPAPRTGSEYLRARARLPGLDLLRSLAGSLVAAERVRRGGVAPILGSVYHLVPRGSAEEYAGRIAGAPGSPWRFRVRGPFPPYAFTGDDR